MALARGLEPGTDPIRLRCAPSPVRERQLQLRRVPYRNGRGGRQKVIINTRKTAVGQRDILASDEDGKIYLKTAGTAGAGGLVIGPDKANYAQLLSGFGTPEGAITAERGSLFLRMDGGAGTCLYVKQTGSGNTGWVGK